MHNDFLKLTENDESLSPVQRRTLRKLSHILTIALKSTNEAEYFESSAELLKECCALIKQADFAAQEQQKIAYGDQAIEFAIDHVIEKIEQRKLINYDN